MKLRLKHVLTVTAIVVGVYGSSMTTFLWCEKALGQAFNLTKRAVSTKKMDSIKKTTLTKQRNSTQKKVHKLHGRRPLVDPFIVGERTALDVTYFNMKVGQFIMEVRPFVKINGSKFYHFVLTLKSKGFFSYFYSVDDFAETYMDYETMTPYKLNIHMKTKGKKRKIHTYFDWKNLKGHYREEKRIKNGKVRVKKKDWNIEPFSQNIVSAMYYLRSLDLSLNKTWVFKVAKKGKNIIFTAEILRKEKLHTAIGTLNTIVLQPKLDVEGRFKPTGDILIWLTDDPRKRLVQMDIKIKLGRFRLKVNPRH